MHTNLSFDSLILLTLCSDIIKRKYPVLSYKQYQKLELKIKKSSIKRPIHLLNSSKEQLINILKIKEETAVQLILLLDELLLIIKAIALYEKKGILITTIYEENYPKIFKERLNKDNPLILYYSGNYDLLKFPMISVFGPIQSSNLININTELVINKINSEGFLLLSGNNRGVEKKSIDYQLKIGGNVVLLTSHDLFKIKKKYQSYLNNSKMLILSHQSPLAEFEVVEAIIRNNYIYGLAYANIIMYTQYNSGAVWFNAVKNIKYKWCKILSVIDDEFYGGAKLVEAGAIPVTIEQIISDKAINKLIEPCKLEEQKSETFFQLSIFEFMEDKNEFN